MQILDGRRPGSIAEPVIAPLVAATTRVSALW